MDVRRILNENQNIPEMVRNIARFPDEAFPTLTAKIKLTWRCNLRCRFCGLWRNAEAAGGKDAITLELVKSILSVLAGRGLRKIHFSGGEVTLREDLEEIVRFACDLGLQVNLTTNGTLVDKRIARFLVEHRIHTVVFSVDEARPRRHDVLRGASGAWKRTWKGIERLQARREAKGRGPKIAVNTVVTRHNIDHLSYLFEMLKDRGIDSWRLLPVRTADPEMRPTEEQWARLGPRIVRWTPLVGRKILDLTCRGNPELAAKGLYADLGEALTCLAPWFSVFVDADGNVLPCCTGRKRIPAYGNVTRRPLEAILSSRIRRELCASFASGRLFEVCRSCDEFLQENSLLSAAADPDSYTPADP